MDFLDFLCQKGRKKEEGKEGIREGGKRRENEKRERRKREKKKTKHEKFYPYNTYKVNKEI